MMSFFLGLLGAAFGAGFFAAGFLLGRRTVPVKAETRPDPENEAELDAQRERLREEQNAFHDLMSYNSDVAYGIKTMPGKK